MPASTTNSAPVMYELASLARNSASSATSSGCPVRWRGRRRKRAGSPSGSMSVSIAPGCTEFTRISGPSSMAATFVSPRTPHFDAPYAPCPRNPTMPAVDEMFTMDERPDRLNSGAHVWMPRNVPIRFTRNMRSNPSTDSSSSMTMWCTAALLTSASRRPNRSIVVASTAAQFCSSRTSRCTKTASSPRSLATVSPAASRMSASTTCAPSRTKRRASASPCPRAAPVMIATLPSRRLTALMLASTADRHEG